MKLTKSFSDNLNQVIKFCDATSEGEWCTDVVRTKDTSKNCLFGHIFNMGDDQKESNQWWNWFEENVASTYMVYPVNDGTNPKYPQSTPKQRCIAYMRDLLNGKEKTCHQHLEDYFNSSQAAGKRGAE